MFYDGVQLHGPMHGVRMQDVFYRRMSIMFQAVVTLATASMRSENQDTVVKQVKRLSALMFPENEEERDDREESLRQTLRSEGSKSYRVQKLYIGERDQRR